MDCRGDAGMSLDPGYLAYPWRRRGLDHELFDHRNLPDAPRPRWPGEAPFALWIVLHLQHFPMDMGRKPFAVPGGMERPYPSYWDYTQRDYGTRIGAFRILRALAARGLSATACVNAALVDRAPPLMDALAEARHEVAASGWDMGQPLHSGLEEEAERAIIARSLAALRGRFGAVRGWHSPAHAESARTPALLAEAGLDWFGDWVNDEMPYPVRVPAGRLHAMPLAWDLSDQRVIFQQMRSTGEFCDSVRLAAARLAAEGGRVLPLVVTSWVTGQPHRIAAFGRLLDDLLAMGAWPATGSAILDEWRKAE